MTPSDMHHHLSAELVGELRAILRRDYRDRLPVKRDVIDAVAEAIELTDRKIVHLETMARALAACLRDILNSTDLPARTDTVNYALEVLGKVEETLQ